MGNGSKLLAPPTTAKPTANNTTGHKPPAVVQTTTAAAPVQRQPTDQKSHRPNNASSSAVGQGKSRHTAPATPTKPNRQAQTGVVQGTPQPTTPPSPAAINNTKQIPAATGTTRVSHSTDQHIAAQGDKISRPSWRDSEIEIGKDYPNYEAQRSFFNGKEVPYGTKESVRPEYYHNGIKHSIEVKNYNIETSAGRNRLINNISS